MNFQVDATLLKSIIYILITVLGAVIIDNLLRSVIKLPKSFDSRRSRAFTTILHNTITAAVYVVALYIIFTVLGVNPTPLLASAGIIGLVVGLIAKPVFDDLLAGFFLLSQDALTVGDYVKIDDAEGYIEAIKSRTLTLRTESGATYIIPNSYVKKVINFSSHRALVIVDIPAKADTNIDLALRSMETALSHLETEKDLDTVILPGSTVNGVEEFRPVGPMIIRATIVTYPSRRFEVGRKYRYLVKKEFEKHKLNFG